MIDIEALEHVDDNKSELNRSGRLIGLNAWWFEFLCLFLWFSFIVTNR